MLGEELGFEMPRKDSQLSIVKVPGSFLSFEHFCNVFFDWWLIETWTSECMNL